MPVGTDGVLLGAWTASLLRSECDIRRDASIHHDNDSNRRDDDSSRNCRILDVGTGTGLLALMLAQTLPDAHIDAIDIDPDAALEAAANVAASPWAARIAVHAASLAAYDAQLPTDSTYRLVVSNPPFYDATLKPADPARAAARHTDALTWDALMRTAARRLVPDGLLTLIHPTTAATAVLTAATVAGLAPVRLVDVTTRLGKPPKRTLAAFSLRAAPLLRSALALTDAHGRRTDAFRVLTSDFYLPESERFHPHE